MSISDFLKRLMLAGALSIGNGKASIMGRYNIVIVSLSSFVDLHHKLSEILGEEKLYEILKEVAFAGIKEAFSVLKPPSILLSDINNLIAFSDIFGIGKFEVIDIKEDEKDKTYIVKISNSPILEYAIKKYGKRSFASKIYMANIYGFFKYIFNLEPKIIEISDQVDRIPQCLFEVKIEKQTKVNGHA